MIPWRVTTAGKRAILAAGLGLAVALLFRTWQQSTHFSLTGERSFELHVPGGSTAYGAPYGPDLRLGRLVSYLFGGELDGRPIVVVNHATEGGTSSQALEAVADVPSDTGVVFLYSGHNEFLHVGEPEDLSAIPRRFIDRDPLSPVERQAILGALLNQPDASRAYWRRALARDPAQASKRSRPLSA